MPRSLIQDGEIFDAADFSSGARRYYRVEGKVLAFYPGVAGKVAPSVDVQPMVNDVRICIAAGVPDQPEGVTPLVEGQRYSEPWPILNKIPVRYPSGGGLALWWDLQPGDKVDLESPDLDPSTYRATGQQSDPPFTRRNSGSFWTAIPGSTTDADALGPSGGLMCIGSTSAPSVTIGASGVVLGAPVGTPAATAVAIDAKVDAALASLKLLAEALSTYAAGIASIADPTSAFTPALEAACQALESAIVPTGSATVKCQP